MQFELGIEVPGSDGQVLKTDVHRPRSSGPVPVLLMRTPYGTGSLAMLRFGRRLARLGWAAVFQNVRGRYGSSETFEPFCHEANDGRATLEWLADQPWCDGRLLPFGVSYSTYTAAALFGEPTPLKLLGMVSIVTMVRPWRHFYQGGAFRLHWALPWALLIDGQRQRKLDLATLREAIHEPLETLPERLGFPRQPWQDWIGQSDAEAPYWQSHEVLSRLERQPPPMLHIGGWYDFSLPSTFELYHRLSASGAARQELIVGPWEHNAIFSGLQRGLEARSRQGLEAEKPGTPVDDDQLATGFTSFLERCRDGDLQNEKPAADELDPRPIRIFRVDTVDTEGGTWLDFESWPPATEEPRLWHLIAGEDPARGRLATVPSATATTQRWCHDPTAPVPVLGGRAWAAPNWQVAGPAELGPAGIHSDRLSFTSEPLERDLEVAGPGCLRLTIDPRAVADQATDYGVRLVDVIGDSATWVSDGIVRLAPLKTVPLEELPEAQRVIVDLGEICYLFRSGHRIRVDLSGSLFPLFDQALRAGPRGIVSGSEESSALELRTLSSNTPA